eukprot:CAMPEP_0182823550 /NCGR_PEP_ID=MMETSP0006_2-20121128/14813_1 /TAXON_ID=97485 /ORGANISM="Prymnesium parvum, Strain Texoma1" /LENGTH=134 /DNA_ID=CAMNT_0024950481 /DNA_START=484 /DNA_END=888 /DNA_ORIENTATION=-
MKHHERLAPLTEVLVRFKCARETKAAVHEHEIEFALADLVGEPHIPIGTLSIVRHKVLGVPQMASRPHRAVHKHKALCRFCLSDQVAPLSHERDPRGTAFDGKGAEVLREHARENQMAHELRATPTAPLQISAR